MIDSLLHGDISTVPLNVSGLLLALSLAFTAGQLISWIYIFTHSGLSYSRSFVGSLVVLPVLVCLVLQVLSNNLVTAFGLMAIFAIVRFRNILRDTLDTAYIVSVIVLGMAAGTMKFATAVIGAAAVAAVYVFLWMTRFGSRHRFDLILNLHWAKPVSELAMVQTLLSRHALHAHCASQRPHEGSEGVDLSYRLLLRDPKRTGELLGDLRELDGVSRVTSLNAEEESEL
ncbi:MAG: DUF4956 domain-containing protein [Verrucomicrobiales bacterium]|nr:DUF4956 domain-containing protein [Verrucomicrobiales bacterium]